ncbi:MAG TPA: histidinol-phosphate transaminase [Gammaproteobacteria bacterium]|nr:histidinol-phosphate transaminase [Gammaproteobacteria bacterium]
MTALPRRCDVLELAVPGVRGLQPYQPGKPIEELQREYGIADVIKLASNENPLGPSPGALAMIGEAATELHRYPDGNGFALKQALSRHLKIDTSQITLGNGSNDVLELVARAFVSPGDEVIFSEHAFAVYPLVTLAVGGRAVVTPARNYGHDLAAMHEALSAQTRVVFIANPNNPTGTWIKRDALHGFLRALPAHVIAVVDEAYFEFVTDPEYPDSMRWLGEFPNLVVTRTFSKIYGLAGLRIGYGVSHPQVADVLNRVRQPFNVNGLALACAAAALRDQAHVRKSVALNERGLRQLEAGFRGLGLEFIPSVGNFICVKVGDAAVVYETLLRQGVIVRPIANYGMPEHLRITVGLETESARFLTALQRSLGK